MKNIIDFKQDLKESTIDFLNQYGVKYKGKDDLMQLLIKLYTFLEKYIDPHQREVFYSKELSCKVGSLPQTTQIALLKLEAWIREGVDINCFQGRGLYGAGSRDYQNALYGIVHLHLSAVENDVLPVIKKDGFAKPGHYLLFVLFHDKATFFIDVVPHPEALHQKNASVTEWTSSNLVKIIENNWSELLEKAKLPIESLCDGNGNPIELNDEDIAEITVSHINTVIAGNQGIYMLGLGVSSNGDSTKAVMLAQKSIKYATQCELCYKDNIEKIHAKFGKILSDNGDDIPTEFDIHLDYIPALNTMIVVDRNSGAAIDLLKGELYMMKNDANLGKTNI